MAPQQTVKSEGSYEWSVNAGAITGSAITLRYRGMNWEKWQAEHLEPVQPDCTLHELTMILCSEHKDLDSK